MSAEKVGLYKLREGTSLDARSGKIDVCVWELRAHLILIAGAMNNKSEGTIMQDSGSNIEDVDMAIPTSASASLKPRSGKISFSVDSLLSGGTRKSPTGTKKDEDGQEKVASEVECRYRELLLEQQRLQNRELLARLSPHGYVGQRTPMETPITVKDFSKSREESSSPRNQDRRARSPGSNVSAGSRRDERVMGNRSVSPASTRREFDDRSDSEANRSLEGDQTTDQMDEDQEIASVGARSEDLNVMDSDCELERDLDANQEKEKSSPVVPQPIHPGVQRSGGPYLGTPGGPGGWNPAGFSHLAGFAWLPPPPHPHSPHGHLYASHGPPTSPNGMTSEFRKRFSSCRLEEKKNCSKKQKKVNVQSISKGWFFDEWNEKFVRFFYLKFFETKYE